MSNFSDFLNNQNNNINNKKENENYTNNQNSNPSNEDLENLINKYSTYSNDDLMKEFLKLTLDKKKKGELKPGELENIKNTIIPFLDENQKQSLNEILKMVENV